MAGAPPEPEPPVAPAGAHHRRRGRAARRGIIAILRRRQARRGGVEPVAGIALAWPSTEVAATVGRCAGPIGVATARAATVLRSIVAALAIQVRRPWSWPVRGAPLAALILIAGSIRVASPTYGTILAALARLAGTGGGVAPGPRPWGGGGIRPTPPSPAPAGPPRPLSRRARAP